MAEPIIQVSLLPEGWNITKDRNGNEQSTRLALEVGDLSVLLKKALKQRWRFNLLTKKIELDGVTVPVAEIDQLYVALSEHGYKIDQSKAKDAAKTAAMANAFHPVTDYLNKVASGPAGMCQPPGIGASLRPASNVGEAPPAGSALRCSARSPTAGTD